MSLIAAALPAAPTCNATTLTHGAVIGLSMTAGASCMSAASILVVAVMILHRVYERRRYPGSQLRPAIKTHVDFYMISLLMSDMLQAVGGTINIHHVLVRRTACGPFCTAQGALKSLGEPSAAMATMAITVHTFCVIFFHWTPPANFILPTVVVGTVWLYCGLYVGISWYLHHASGHEFFQPVPFWCWVSKLYPAHRIAAEYFWLWFSAFSSILFYVPLFLFIRGNIEVDAVKPWKMKWRKSEHRRQVSSFNRNRQSLKMLLYPIVYLVIVLPLSAVRYIAFVQGDNKVPPAGTFVGIVPFHLAGMLNVLLLIFTRPSILVFGGGLETQGTTSTSQGGAASNVPRYNLSQAMEVSVHVQKDMYGYTEDGRKVPMPYSPRIGARRYNSDHSGSVVDIKPEHIQLEQVSHVPMSGQR
ncbi:hypothetical protein BKA62DRAFT_770231 [Auriculariales sp. MPI-PUGE-AT-0066]|nr:hypothetical protein BKA62DRAFT_770231 [Auriculariales sp. MPI-PUGE-AT-0066]